MDQKKYGVFLGEIANEFEAECFKRKLSHQDALKQAAQLWLGHSLPTLPPEFPNDMEPKERKIAASIIRRRRLSKNFATGIDALINVLPDVKQG